MAEQRVQAGSTGCTAMTTTSCRTSGKEVALPSPPPLRTVRATFTAYGSSLCKRLLRDALPPLRAKTTARYSSAAAACFQGRPHQQALPPPTSACLLQRLVELSRAARPEGSLPAFAWGDIATPIRPITGRRSLAPSSSARLRVGRPCGFPTPKGRRRVYHVPSMYREKVRSRLSAGGASSACGKFGIPQLVPLPFGPGLSASLACHH